MTEIVGIQFKNNSRVYYFAPGHFKFNVGDYAIVETVRGMELGRVIIENRKVEDEEVSYELKPIIRKANDNDVKQEKKYEELAKSSFEFFKEAVSEQKLPMKPLYAEYTIDGSKILFYYSADDRVDFRDLLKVLTPKFKTRVELRQIGPREAARIIGGIGSCGRVICCKSCLNNFDYVTIKMAKEQNMSLNTNKISGLCGKLMCCIGYEHEMYKALRKEIPNPGELVKTPNCPCCKVVDTDYIKKIISVAEKDDGIITKYSSDEVERLVKKDPNIDEGVENVVTDDEIINLEDNDEKIEEIVPQEKKHKKIYKPFVNNKKGNKKKSERK